MEVILVSDLPVTAMDGTLKALSSLAGHDIDKLLEGYCQKPNLTSTSIQQEFEFRLHFHSDIHPTTTPPGTLYVVVVVNCPS